MSKAEEPEIPELEVVPVERGAIEEYQHIGQRSIYLSTDPQQQLAEARDRAKILVEVVREQGLSKSFGGGRPHVFVEGWQFLASQFGLIPDIEWTRELEDGWEARASLRRLYDGAVVANAEGECRKTEANWANRQSYAIRSMAQTRAVSKVCRVALAPVMVMAGYGATPAEEMDGYGASSGFSEASSGPVTADDPHCPACLDVHGTLVRVTGPHDRKPFWRCTADPKDCGGFRTYQDKEYSWSGWRTSWENSVAEWRHDVIKNDPQETTIDPDERTQRSDYIVREIMGLTGLISEVDAKVLVKPGLTLAIDQGTVDAGAALGGKPGNPISDDELRIIAVNLTYAEAEAVIAAAASLKPNEGET